MKVKYIAPYKNGMHQRIINEWEKQYPWRNTKAEKITIFARKFIQDVSEKEKQEYLLHYRQYEFYFYVASPDTLFEYFEFTEVVHESQPFEFMHLYNLVVSIVLDWLYGYEYEGKQSGSYRQVSPPLEAYKDVPYFQMGDRSKQINYHLLDSYDDMPDFSTPVSVEVFYFDLNWNLKSITINAKEFVQEEEFRVIMKGKFIHFFGRKRSMKEALDY